MVGDLVYISSMAKKVGLSPKLQDKWQGPLVISKVLGPVLYQIKSNKISKIVHFERLKPYLSEHFPGWVNRLHNILIESEQQMEEPRGNSTENSQPVIKPSDPQNSVNPESGVDDHVANIPLEDACDSCLSPLRTQQPLQQMTATKKDEKDVPKTRRGRPTIPPARLDL